MSWLEQAKTALKKTLAEIEQAGQDEAHLATRGDRPFPGCRPDAPGDRPSRPRQNGAAKQRPAKP